MNGLPLRRSHNAHLLPLSRSLDLDLSTLVRDKVLLAFKAPGHSDASAFFRQELNLGSERARPLQLGENQNGAFLRARSDPKSTLLGCKRSLARDPALERGLLPRSFRSLPQLGRRFAAEVLIIVALPGVRHFIGRQAGRLQRARP